MILVPHLNGIELECQYGLQQLEAAGVRVWRRGGSSAIDVARNVMASEALHNDCKYIFFIDSDISFQITDALKLIESTEPVISGIYAKKGIPGIVSVFEDNESDKIRPLRYAATGFLRIKSSVLKDMITQLKLPLCNTKWGKGIWPFFQPMVVPDGDGHHYLGEDWAFSHRLRLIGITPMADMSIKLLHWGRYGYMVGSLT